jgi:hypothetical protein
VEQPADRRSDPGSGPSGLLVRAEGLAQRFLTHVRDHEPVEATRLGLAERDADLPDLTTEALTARGRGLAALAMDVDRALAQVPADPGGDDREAHGDLSLLRDELAYRRFLLEDRPVQASDPLAAIDTVATGVHLLLQQVSVDPGQGPEGAAFAAHERRRRVAAAIARARRVPAFLERAGTLLVSAPAPHLAAALERLPGLVALVRDELPRQAALAGVEVDDARDAGEYAAEGLQAFGALLAELSEEPAAGWRLGPEGHAFTLRTALGAALPPREVEARALATIDRVRGEVAELVAAGWQRRHPGVPLASDPGERMRAALAALADTAVPARRFLAEAERAIDEARAYVAARGMVDLPPAERLTVGAVPEHLRGVAVAFLMPPAPLDPRRGSTYFLSDVSERWDRWRTTAFLREHHPAMLRSLAIHEGYPGHFVQLEHAVRHPRALRRLITRPVFAEGWAVHMERVVIDEGFGTDGSSDVAADDLRLTQRVLELRVAVDALLDLGLHSGTMSDGQALDLLQGRGLLGHEQALGKLSRAKVTAGQLSSYFVGGEELDDLRRATRAREGSAFDLADFHRRVLSHGTPPVAIVAAALTDGAPARRPFAPATVVGA